MPDTFIKLFAHPYIGGDSEEKVIVQAQEIYREKKYLTTLDALGEDVQSRNDINKFANIYLDLVKKIAKLNEFKSNYEKPSVSLKPSCFNIIAKKEDGSIDQQKTDWRSCYENIQKICSYARENNVRVTVEMEDRHWTDFTLETYFKLLNEGLDNVGTVIQTRLFRTEKDLEMFDSRCRVRLVIGIYNEPEEVALTDKELMKQKMLDFAKILFKKGVFVEFATHDEQLIRRFFTEVIIPEKIGQERYELQMLLGVPREELQKELVNGQYLARLRTEANLPEENKVNFRLYLPFAQDWQSALAYCRRRLIENPNIAVYGLKNLVVRN